MEYKSLKKYLGWLVFLVASVVYIATAERTGSLWDCGEFIACAYKLQVPHAPGAPLFLLVGRVFALIGELFSSDVDNIENVAFAVNIMSGLFTAGTAMMAAWVTMIFGERLLGAPKEEIKGASEQYLILGAGLLGGLTTAFCTSIWFSAVEGEVYAMSLFLSAFVMWIATHWFHQPDSPKNDRWLVLAFFMVGLSIGVHLLSLLVIPYIAVLFYLKKYKEQSYLGMFISFLIGFVILVIVQNFIILKVPAIGAGFDYTFVNSLGLPVGSGILFFFLALLAGIGFVAYNATKNGKGLTQLISICTLMVMLGFSTYGTAILRAKANPPINIGNPSDAYSLLSYLNREQYGTRPLLFGPDFNNGQPTSLVSESPRYGYNGSEYVQIGNKQKYGYSNEMFFPRIGHSEKAHLYPMWIGDPAEDPVSYGDNLEFFFKAQLGWFYWRYFMWNFTGRQNSHQGMLPHEITKGNWISGFSFYDDMRLGNVSEAPDSLAKDLSTNKYYFIPFILGLIGLIFMFQRRNKDAIALLILFLMTGVVITLYTNQPPIEPRERDYVLVGSFMVFAIWIGLSVIAIYSALKKYIQGIPAVAMSVAIVAIAPFLMGSQNYNDNDRSELSAARDYAKNYLASCEKDAILFTYGDNDTYPLWFAQEVEKVRPDIRMINLSLIHADYYIHQMFRVVNESKPIKFTIPHEKYFGAQLNTVPRITSAKSNEPVDVKQLLRRIGSTGNMVTNNLYFRSDPNKVLGDPSIIVQDSSQLATDFRFDVPLRSLGNNNQGLIKGTIALLDIIASNIDDRPIYFASSVPRSEILGLGSYLQYEGYTNRVVPVNNQQTAPGKYPLYAIGQIDTDGIYNRIMSGEYTWGGLDKKELEKDPALAPLSDIGQTAFLRTGQSLLRKGETEKAQQVVRKYFDVYNRVNFDYDAMEVELIKVAQGAGDIEFAKIHTKAAAQQVFEELIYQSKLDPTQINGLSRVFSATNSTANSIEGLINNSSFDQAFKTEIKNLIGK